jgi:Tol biopolymer transport system component
VKKLVVLAALVLVVPASATTSRIVPLQDAWPVWSPTAGRIAFMRISANSMALEILRLGAHSSVTQVARNAGQLSPSWSSDGTRLAYSAGGRIYVVTADGASRQQMPFPGFAYAPAFQPGGTEIAYLTSHGARNLDLWVDGSLRARNAIGRPAWASDGKRIAFQRDDGIYVSSANGSVAKVATASNPGPPVFSGDEVLYTAQSRIWRVDVTTGDAPTPISPAFADIGTPTLAVDRDGLAFTWRQGLEVESAGRFTLVAPAGLGAAWSPSVKGESSLAYAGPRAVCPGHTVLRLRRDSGSDVGLTGSCVVSGTPRADVIEGSPREGDVILGLAGNDQIHANDGHTDTVNCGPGHDTVWADRTDRLTACEIVHR